MPQKASSLDLQRRIVILGGDGVGKTTVLGSFISFAWGHDGKPLYVTSDKEGMATLAYKVGLNMEALDVEYIDDWGNPYEHYFSVKEWLADQDAAGPKVLCIDDIGFLQEETKEAILTGPLNSSERYEQRRNGVAFEEKVLKGVSSGDRKFEMQNWGQLETSFKWFLGAMRRLPWDIIVVTSREREADNPLTRQRELSVGLQGSSASWVAALSGLTLHLFTHWDDDAGRSLFCANSARHPLVRAKDRYGDPRTWINPTAEKILAHMHYEGLSEDPETMLEKSIGVGADVGQRRGRSRQ